MLLDPTAIELGAAALIGASIGAFAATAAIRLSEGRNPWRGRSCCDGCGRQLSVRETIPILGYVTSKGRCRTCRAQIDPLQPVSEFAGLVLLPLCLWWWPGLDGVLIGALAMLLLTTAIVDLRTYRLLDVFTIPIVTVSAMLAYRHHELGAGFLASIISALILSGLKLSLERKRLKPMLGWGDVKLVSAVALGLGDRTSLMMVIAAGLGLLAVRLRPKDAGGQIPFGPMLTGATILTYFALIAP
ncbi:MAG TPA: prepilin peptidase [Asticcacaulis sp.]|nr:prepilin peptidase [Asticcacaulis sp.]